MYLVAGRWPVITWIDGAAASAHMAAGRVHRVAGLKRVLGAPLEISRDEITVRAPARPASLLASLLLHSRSGPLEFGRGTDHSTVLSCLAF